MKLGNIAKHPCHQLTLETLKRFFSMYRRGLIHRVTLIAAIEGWQYYEAKQKQELRKHA
jgi:predicted negative regulator of RcsB-dependent stress response